MKISKDLLDVENVRDLIRLRLVREELADTYTSKENDINGTVTCLAIFDDDGSALICKQSEQALVKCLGMTLDEIFALAEDNTEENVEFRPLGIMLVCTNTERCFGAASIVTTGVRKHLKEKLDKGYKLAVIPSSVHEVLLLPDFLLDGDKDTDTIKLIQDVNSTLEPGEKLADTYTVITL